MPEQRPDPGEVAAYADGRWPVVVRTLVLLGAPPRHAVALATEAVGRLFHRSADDQWLDLDAVLAAEVVDVWEADRTAWWRRADLQVDEDLDGTGVPEALVLLDVLPPAERARLVVGAVAGLTSDQLDDVLGPAVSSPLVGAWRDDLARVAVAIPVGDAHLDEARGLSDGRRRQGRGLAVAGLVAGLVAATVAVTVAVGAIDPQPGPPPGDPTSTVGAAGASGGSTSADGDRAAEPVDVSRGPDLTPVAWYDGRRVHLADRAVRVPRVRAMVRVGDGVVATDERGRVLHVLAGGTVRPLGRTAPGATAVAEPDRLVAAWIDAATDDLVVQPFDGDAQLVAVAAGSRVVAMDRGQVYLEGPDGAQEVGVADGSVAAARPGLLDASSGARVRRVALGLVGVDVGRRMAELDGQDGWLSDDGRYLLTRDVGSGAAPPSVVVDLGTPRRARLPLPLPASSIVVDAAFGGDGRVTFVLARANGTLYPADRPRDGDDPPGFDLLVCDLDAARCQQDAMLFDSDVAPVLAR